VSRQDRSISRVSQVARTFTKFVSQAFRLMRRLS
jgi:hypothetical protein